MLTSPFLPFTIAIRSVFNIFFEHAHFPVLRHGTHQPNPWVVRLAFALKGVDTGPFIRKLTAVDGVPENRGDTSLTVSVSYGLGLPCLTNATFCDGSTILGLSLALSRSHIPSPTPTNTRQILNPQQSTPFMELADGSIVAESVSMVQYIDALYPGGGSTGQCKWAWIHPHTLKNVLLRTPAGYLV